jgi:hypothetical protein
MRRTLPAGSGQPVRRAVGRTRLDTSERVRANSSAFREATPPGRARTPDSPRNWPKGRTRAYLWLGSFDSPPGHYPPGRDLST